MRLKKFVAVLLTGALVLSSVACGSNNKENTSAGAKATSESESAGTDSDKGGSDKKVVIWATTNDLKTWAEEYQKQTGKEVEVVVIQTADYPTKLATALGGKSDEVDVIMGEPQMLPNFFEAGYFEDLSASYEADQYKDKIVDYVWQAGQDADGHVRAISYQTTPGSVIYRRDIAKKVWGTDDPAEIGKKFADFPTITKTGEELNGKGYKIFTDTGCLRWFAYSDSPWVKDGKLNLTDHIKAYMDTAVELYTKGYTAFAQEWSSTWMASMSGPIPADASEIMSDDDLKAYDGDTTEVFSYVLPSWGALIIRDNAGDLKGNYGVCKGPTSFFGGGSFIGINSYSKNKDAAWDFIKWVTLNDESSQWWLEKSNGDVVSNKAVLEANKDFENESFGGQKTYEFFMQEAQNIDYSNVTRYDTDIDKAWGTAIESVQKGEATKEDAINTFYASVQAIFPEIEIPQ